MRVAIILTGLATLVFAQAEEASLESPSQACTEMEQRRPTTPPSSEQKEKAAAYLARWDKAGREAKGRERLDLGRLHTWAGEIEVGLSVMRAVAADGAADAVLRADARKQYALAVSQNHAELSATGITTARKALTAIVKEGEGDDSRARSRLWTAMTYVARADGDWKATREAAENAIQANAIMAFPLTEFVIAAQMSGVYRMEEYEGLRDRVKDTVAGIEESVSQSLPKSRAMPGRMMQIIGRKMDREMKRIDLLGKPVLPWTVEHALQGPSTLAEQKDRVVLIYFWQTRSPEAVRGLATLRDLDKRYKDKPFAIVTVTWSGTPVYASRYEYDIDVDNPGNPSDPSKERDADGATQPREQEHETISAFLKNHRITWPTVMIPAKEAGPRKGGGGSPWTLLIDTKGRVRYITSGALRRASKISTKEIPKVIDALLNESPR